MNFHVQTTENGCAAMENQSCLLPHAGIRPRLINDSEWARETALATSRWN